MAKFSEVLKNRNFFIFWIGQVVSQFGDRLSQMALIALIAARAPGSTFQLAKTLSFTIIPVFFVGPIAAGYVDRWDRRRTMCTVDFLRAVMVALLVFTLRRVESIWPVYLTVFLIFSLTRFFVPAKIAVIPELVTADKLLLANSLASTTGMVAFVAGFGLGGLVVEHFGFQGGFIIDSFTYLISGSLILMIVGRTVSRFRKKDVIATVKDMSRLIKKTIFSDIKEGWQYIAQAGDVRFIARIFFLLGSAAGAVAVVVIVFVQSMLGSVTRDLGLLAMTLGLGLFSGSLLYGRFGGNISKIKTIFIALGTGGVVLAAFTVSLKALSSHTLAYLLSFMLGLTISPIIACAYTLIHQVAKQSMHGRIFGALEIVAHLGFLIFMLLSAFLAEQIGRFWILLFIGAALALIGFTAIIFKLDRKRTDLWPNMTS